MAANEQQARLLRPGEVAQKLGVSVETLRRWRLAQTGPEFVALGNSGHVRYLPLKVAGRSTN